MLIFRGKRTFRQKVAASLVGSTASFVFTDLVALDRVANISLRMEYPRSRLLLR